MLLFCYFANPFSEGTVFRRQINLLQTVAQYYFKIGPINRVIRVVAFRGIKRQCTRMPVRANTGQSPKSVPMLGQRRIRCTGIETVMGCDAGPTLNRYCVGRPKLCVTGHRIDAYTDLSVAVTAGLRSGVKKTSGTTWMLASTGDGGGRNRPTR